MMENDLDGKILAIWFRRLPGRASSSSLGGLPNLPADVDWPRHHQSGAPLHFLGQVDLSHLPTTPLGDARNAPILPKTGFLFFFADMVEEMRWNDNGGALSSTRVIFAEQAGPERAPPEDTPDIGHPFEEKSSEYTKGKVVFAHAALEPHVIETFDEEIVIPDAVVEALTGDPDRFGRKPGSPSEWPVHQMLGVGMNIQGTAEEAHAKGLMLLFQFDSDFAVDEEFMYCDVGMAQFWIKPDDLAARRFDKAWATTEGG